MQIALAALVGVVNRSPWSGVWLLAACPLFWFMGWNDRHRSYVIATDGVTLRRQGRDLEQVAWTEVATVRAWPLQLVLHSGRKISLNLNRSDMQRAVAAVARAFPEGFDDSTRARPPA